MSRYSASTALRDHLKPFLRCLPRRQHGMFLALSRGLLQAGESNLSEACRSAGGGRICRWVERASLLLRDLPWDALLARHDHRLRLHQEDWRLIITDTTALPKPWAQEMEGLSNVYDGCTGEIVNGYTVIESIGVGGDSWDIHPIRFTLINPQAESFRSQNIALQEHTTEILHAGIGGDLLHVYDRGFDDEKHFRFLDAEKTAWMVRLKENRNVTFRGEEHPLPLVADTLLSEPRVLKEGDCTYARSDIGITFTHDAEGKGISPETRMYALVCVKRETYAKPLLLLLNGKVKCPEEAAALYADYLDRWEVETGIRLWKQTLNPAVVQLMSCDRIQGLLHLQTFLLDFLLRETADGRDPFGRGLHEILQREYLHAGETLIFSPYVVARALRNLLRTETQNLLHQPLRPRPSAVSQLPLLTRAMLDAV